METKTTKKEKSKSNTDNTRKQSTLTNKRAARTSEIGKQKTKKHEEK